MTKGIYIGPKKWMQKNQIRLELIKDGIFIELCYQTENVTLHHLRSPFVFSYNYADWPIGTRVQN